MTYRVIVIGQGFTSRLHIIRSFAFTGYEIFVIVMMNLQKDGKTLNTRKPVDCYSKYVSQVYYNQSNDGEGLVNLLMTRCIKEGQKPIIISVGDFVTTVIDNHLEMLEKHFLFSHIQHRQGAIVEWMNKEKQKELAQSVGLNVVESCCIEIKDAQYEIPSGLHYPCFTKSRAYLPGCKFTLNKCDNEIELVKCLDDLSKKFNLTLLVEEYKRIETEYAVVGFSDGKDVVIPGIIKILSLAHGNHFGVACKGEVMPVDGYEELVSRFKEFILKVGYVGLFDIDFYYSEGKFFFGELNLRMGGSGYAVLKTGVNLPLMYAKSLFGDCLDSMSKDVSRNAVFINDRMLIGDWQGGYISTNKLMKSYKEADFGFVSESNDKSPQYVLLRNIVMIFMKKLLKDTIKIWKHDKK